MATESNWLARMQEEQRQSGEKGKAYFLGLLPVLKAAGAAKLVVHYDGSGDSGQIESIAAYQDSEGQTELPIPELNTELVDNAACQVLSGLDID